MSDEEKKAWDNLIMLKYFTMEKEDKQAIDTILNLIEKQQKEIEELKKYEEGYKLLSYSLENYISKDKIKAKIEEINKEMLNEEKSLELFYRKKYCKEALQLLLEKE